MKRRHASPSPVRPGTKTRAWITSFLATVALFATTNPSFALEPIAEPGKITSGAALMISSVDFTGFGAAARVTF